MKIKFNQEQLYVNVAEKQGWAHAGDIVDDVDERFLALLPAEAYTLVDDESETEEKEPLPQRKNLIEAAIEKGLGEKKEDFDDLTTQELFNIINSTP